MDWTDHEWENTRATRACVTYMRPHSATLPLESRVQILTHTFPLALTTHPTLNAMLELQPINVPFDIIYEILQHCDNTSLANFALLNKTYRSASEPLLYRSLTFDEEDRYSGRLEKCLTTLSVCPQKALCATRMVLKLAWRNFNNVRYDYGDDRFFGYLATALIAAGNLQYLVLKVNDFLGINDIKTRVLLCPILRKCTFSLHTIAVPECIEPALWAQRHDNLRDIQIFYSELGFNYEYLQVYEKWTTESSFMLTVSGPVGVHDQSLHSLSTPLAANRTFELWSSL
ncbi:hypothetical protein H0H93_005972 [Arthromyces matolae]|nr:hypothetical protein H0H93_005972 [Arthromyces matolae]